MSADLTLILGPQSTGGLLLNLFIREQGAALTKQGVRTMPMRRAAPLLRRAMDTTRPFRDRKAEFKRETEPRPAILGALNAFGPPEAAIAADGFFPGAEAILGPAAKMGGLCNVVIAIEPLPHLFLASASARLEARARATAWEVLYELSWAALLTRVLDRMKAAQVLVLTPQGMATRSPEVLTRIFGQNAVTVADPYWLLRRSVNDTGIAVLERLLVQGEPPVSTLAEVYGSFALSPREDEIETRLGIERITAELLDRKFAEDLALIRKMPRVEVI